MKLAILFSGGKDSTLALQKAKEHGHEITCLISLISENPESYMFHVPNIHLTKLQAEAMEIPIIQHITKGVKEKELEDLKQAIQKAIEKYQIEGLVTGAVRSTYQAARIQRICHKLNIWCFNPLWLKDQIELLHEVEENFTTIISGVFAYPLDETWLGKQITKETIEKLRTLQNTYQLNPAGEGGEIETTVLDADFFKKKIVIEQFRTEYKNYAGSFIILKATLKEK